MSGLPQVCKLLFEVSKDMLCVEHLAPKVLMAVNDRGRQLTRRLGWAVPSYHKKEGVTIHPAMHKHSLQYDRRLMGAFGCVLECGI